MISYYVGYDKVEDRNLSCLVGMHESYLNFALHAYENDLIDDWISFFREDWATVLYHDRFAAFLIKVKDQLCLDKGFFTIAEEIHDMASTNNDDMAVSAFRRKLLGERCQNLPELTKKLIENQVNEYVKTNKGMLNRFYTQSSSTRK